MADSYEIINEKEKACAMGIFPEPNGTLDVAEAVTQTDETTPTDQRMGSMCDGRRTGQTFNEFWKVKDSSNFGIGAHPHSLPMGNLWLVGFHNSTICMWLPAFSKRSLRFLCCV